MKIINKHKIGLLGGTFDPPHKGHLHISREAINILKLHNLYWSIANQNPLKQLKPKLTINQRMLLAKKIIKKNKKILVLKKNKSQKLNYSINEINFIKEIEKNSVLFFIIGADNLVHFHKWKNYKTILKKCVIIVMHRPGYKIKALQSKLAKQHKKLKINLTQLKENNYTENKWIYLNIKGINLSSSMIRNSL